MRSIRPVLARTRLPQDSSAALGPADIVGRFLRYLLTGGSAAVMDLALFMALIAVTGHVLLAALVSFVIAITYNFLISARFAFTSRRGWRRYAVFVTGASMGLMINVGVTVQAAATGLVPLAAAKILGIGIAFIFNFLFNHFVTFAARRPS